jgi:DNA-binding HxlR family transcriptional regulator
VARLPFDPIDEARRQWTAHWGEDATAAMGAVTSVMRVQQILLARLNALLDPFGLTFARYEALMILFYSRRGSLPLGKMGDRLQVHRTAITNIVDRLERDGLVARVPHENDRRTTLAEITRTSSASSSMCCEAFAWTPATSGRNKRRPHERVVPAADDLCWADGYATFRLSMLRSLAWRYEH